MLKLKLQYFGHLMQRVDSLEKTLMLGGIGGRRRRGQQRMRWLDGITWLNGLSLSELQELVMDREVWRAVIHGVAKSRTRLSDWTELNVPLYAYTIFCLSTIHWWMLGCFHILSTANNTALSIGIQISVWVLAFSCFGCILRNEIAVSCGNSIFQFFEEPL